MSIYFSILPLILVVRAPPSVVPQWGAGASVDLALLGDDCLKVTWPLVGSEGGGPVLCYEVSRGDAGDWQTIFDCGAGLPGERHLRTCGFSKGEAIQFKVFAISKVGTSAALESSTIYWEWLLAGPDSVILDPQAESTHTSGDMPSILVRSYFPALPVSTIDTISVGKIFVAQLVSRCKLDPVSGSIVVPLEPGDDFYVASNEIPFSDPPVFVTPLAPSGIGAGLYSLLFDDSVNPLAGKYSLLISGLEPGGLLGQYWGNPFFELAPDLERKDEEIDFAWGQTPLLNVTGILMYDLVSVRWTGFVESEFKELYQFAVESSDYMQVWVDGVVELDLLDTGCSVTCTFSVELGGLGHYHSLRIDYYHSKGFVQSLAAGIRLKWSSYSQPSEVVPVSRLFKGVFVNHEVFAAITFVPDVISGADSLVTLPTVPIEANSVTRIYIQSRDEFGQNRRSSDEAFFLTLTCQSTTVMAETLPVAPLAENGYYFVDVVLVVAGEYVVVIVDSEGNSIRADDVLAFTVVPAAAVSVTLDSMDLLPVANDPIQVFLTLHDAFGNELDGAILESMPEIFVAAAWQSDLTALTRLGANFNDIQTREDAFGFTFVGDEISWDATVSLFLVELTVPISGLFELQASVNGNPVTETSSFTVTGNITVEPANSVVTTKPFPPAQLQVGVEYACSVQLRDASWNVIQSTPEGLDFASPVRVRIDRPFGRFDEATCEADVTDGVFLCAITPTVDGTDVELTVLVNGEHATYIPDQTVVYTPAVAGPWHLPVVA